MRRSLILLSVALLILTGCDDYTLGVVEEKKDSRIHFTGLDVDTRGRAEVYPGILLNGNFKGLSSYIGEYYLKLSVADASGKILEMNFNDTLPAMDSLAPDSSRRVWSGRRPLTWYIDSKSQMAAKWRCLIPYPWIEGTPGSQVELMITLEGFEGAREYWTPLNPWLPQQEPDTVKADAKMKMKLAYTHPALFQYKLNVGKVIVSTDKDPGNWDFSLFHTKSSAGYPDPMFTLMVDGKAGYISQNWKNTLTCSFEDEDPNKIVWLTDENPQVEICFWDWDEKLFDNKHDEIGCWEGKLKDLSSDFLKPTVLKAGSIEWAEVSVVTHKP